MSQDPVVVTFVGRTVTPAVATVKVGPHRDDRMTLREMRELVESTRDWPEVSVVEAMIASSPNRFVGLRVRDVTDGDRKRTVHTVAELERVIGNRRAVLRSERTGTLYSVASRRHPEKMEMRMISPSQPMEIDLVLTGVGGLQIIWMEEEK